MMAMKGILLSILLVSLSFTLLGCGAMDQTAASQVDIRGDIVEVRRMEPSESEDGAILGAILVQGSVEADTRYDNAWITMANETEIVDERGQGRVQSTFDDIAVGQRVEIRFAGEVKETYPLQGTAGEVAILLPNRMR